MLDDEEADYRFKDSDKDKDGKLKWAEIIEQTYGYKPKHIKRMREKKPEHMKLFLKVRGVDGWMDLKPSLGIK